MNLPLHQLRTDGLHYQTLPPELQSLEAISASANDNLFQQRYHLDDAPQPAHGLHATNPFEHSHGLPHSPSHFQAIATPFSHAASRFNLIPGPPAPQHLQPPPAQQPLPRAPPQLPELDPQHDYIQASGQAQDPDDIPVSNHGQFEGLKLIPNPPNLDEWRERLFHVDDTITLTEEDFQTYFPHVDNVYSHRSTQRHKRKRFVSHYWDCRLKGRPPGTKKSTDPDKKKRKRVARERDLCDVKIKITEYFDGAELIEQTGMQPPVSVEDTQMEGVANAFFGQAQVNPQAWGMHSVGLSMGQEKSQKYYTIQRVNGNGGNGKGDGVAGPHKHTLEESDRVKKNSVIRWLMKHEKERKKGQGGDSSKKTYHKRATANALATVKLHSRDEDLKLFGSCFCPFVQRVWISLEHKQLPYQYIEVDPYKKPQSLLDINPRGLVPAIRHGPSWSTHESTVIMEYLEDLGIGRSLLPVDAQTRATCRLWADHVNRHIVPCFYRLLQAQDTNDQVTHATELRTEIGKLVDAADSTGPFFLGRDFGFVDVQIAPWVIRLRRVLALYRGWPEPEEGSRWKLWIDAIENERSVRMTTSGDELYKDSYERYAENRPDTSQLANAVNSGRGLP